MRRSQGTNFPSNTVKRCSCLQKRGLSPHAPAPTTILMLLLQHGNSLEAQCADHKAPGSPQTR